MSPKECPEQLCTALKKHHLFISLVQDMPSALEILKSHINTFVLLDLGLRNAIAFLEEVVTTFYDPPPYIIAFDMFPCSLAKADVLNLGADACLDKPLDAEEVFAVVNSVLRRADRLVHPKPLRTAQRIEMDTLSIDPLCRDVTIDGRAVTLTVKEFDILHFLASYPGIVFSKEQIYERVWNEDYNFTTTSVSDAISSLRKKLGLSPKDGRYIQTVRGIGYRFVDP